jgi:hypothetical protein
MTTWTMPDEFGRTERTVGTLAMSANEHGHWSVSAISGLPESESDAPCADLASAQSAADAVVEAIYAAMGADLGLVFGPFFMGERSAISVDGAHYSITRLMDGRFDAQLGSGVAWSGVLGTESAAIAAARAHDAARRGAR